jgi:ankyrin repeat protein
LRLREPLTDTFHGSAERMMHFTGTQLHVAAAKGDVTALRAVISRGANVNCRRKDGFTALLVAAHFGRVDVMQELIRLGANVSLCANDGRSPIDAAAERGHAQAVSLLLENGACFSDAACLHAVERGQTAVIRLLHQHWSARMTGMLGDDGQTLMCNAAQHGRADSISTLLSLLGSSGVDETNADGDTPLHVAALHGHLGVVRLLAGSLRAKAATRNAAGHTPLDLACACGHADVARALVAFGAPLTVAGAAEEISAPVFSPLYIAAFYSKADIARLLVSLGADVGDRSSAGGLTALHAAAIGGDPATLGALLELGADAGARDVSGCTALHAAAAAGQVGSVAFLASAAADVGALSEDGCTALMIAAASGHDAVVSKLLSLGQDATAADLCDMTALHHAAKNGRTSCVCLLLQQTATAISGEDCGSAGVVFRATLLAAAGGHSDTVRRLLEAAPVHAAGQALRAACEVPCGLAIPSLALVGVPTAVPTHRHLLIAAAHDNVHAIKQLVALGADVNCSVPVTAVFVAACSGHVAALAALVEAGAWVNVPCAKGTLPIFAAHRRGFHAAVELLAAAMVSMRNLRNRS